MELKRLKIQIDYLEKAITVVVRVKIKIMTEVQEKIEGKTHDLFSQLVKKPLG